MILTKATARLAATLVMAVAGLAATAQTVVEQSRAAAPREEMFLDMAVTAARKSLNDGGAPDGAVIVANGAWKATGVPTAGAAGVHSVGSAVVNAIADLRGADAAKCVIYAINRPTAADVAAIASAGIPSVIYVNDADDVVAAGIANADDFVVKPGEGTVTLVRVANAEAASIVKNYKKSKK